MVITLASRMKGNLSIKIYLLSFGRHANKIQMEMLWFLISLTPYGKES